MNLSKNTFEYKKTNDCSIQADVYKAKIENSPVIIFIHGGGLIWGSRKDIIPEQVKLYNDAGFTVVSIDYRLAPETKLESIIEDIKDAVKWVKYEGPTLFQINPSKIAVVGSSAGGFLSLITGTFKEKPNAIVSFYGYANILGDWTLKPNEFYCNTKPIISKHEAYSIVGNKPISESKLDRFLFYLYCRQKGNWIREISGLDTIFGKNKLRSLSPINNISNDYPTTLLIHGDKDTDVPYEESVGMYNELRNNGIECELLTIKDADHTFDYNMNNPAAVDSIKTVINFLNRVI